ncbi:response regulator [Cohnella mopanensis]|uniref:response regulator n=1 Tax=Cohnella mopanensis TaxID=2911966 RepID=UPI001EF80067|nr:response regulator [Cohnella mopanensis]
MKILIVDDESAIHEQLEKLIPWKELGWEIVGHAYNGEEARKMTETYRPNLILTDLKMPFMDGIDFMAWLDKSERNAKVIVLSGYGDFEYSRSAFMLGAYDYLLKPVQEAELLLALDKVVEQIHKDSQSEANRINEKAVLGEGLVLMQDQLFTQVIGAAIKDENEIVVQAQRLLIRLPETGYAAVVVRFTDLDEQVQSRYEGDRTAFYYAARNIIREAAGTSSLVCRNLQLANEFVLLRPLPDKKAQHLEPMLRNLQRSLAGGLKIKAMIGISSCKTRIEKIAAAYSEAQQALETLQLAGENSIAYYDGKSHPMPTESAVHFENLWKEILMLFDLLVEKGSLRENDKLIRTMDEAFCEERLCQTSGSDWKKAVMELFPKMERHSTQEDMRLLLNEARAATQALQFKQAKTTLEEWISRWISLSSAEGKDKSGKPLIEAIHKYIDEHYRSVSLDEISERFYLNKNYFCTLFKNTTGQSFMEYLTGIRMEHAKRLLHDSTLKTYEIANSVGYSDQRYFSQVFRKHTGIQPTQYRQAMSKERNQA